MSLPRFIFFAILIFILELVLPPLLTIGWLLFPAFAIFYLLKSPDRPVAGGRVLIAGVAFDAFSGLSFGWFSLLLTVVVLSIWFAQRWLAIDQRAFLGLAFYSLLFLAEFVVLTALVVGDNGHLLLRQLPLLAGEAIVILICFNLLWPHPKAHSTHGLQ